MAGESSGLRRRWARRLAEWRASGWGPVEYCRRRGLKPWQFYYWRQRLGAVQEARAGFLPVQLTGGLGGRSAGEAGAGSGVAAGGGGVGCAGGPVAGMGSGLAGGNGAGRSGEGGRGQARVPEPGAVGAALPPRASRCTGDRVLGAAGAGKEYGTRVRVRLRNGRVLSFAAGLPAEWASRLADALEGGQPC